MKIRKDLWVTQRVLIANELRDQMREMVTEFQDQPPRPGFQE